MNDTHGVLEAVELVCVRRKSPRGSCRTRARLLLFLSSVAGGGLPREDGLLAVRRGQLDLAGVDHELPLCALDPRRTEVVRDALVDPDLEAGLLVDEEVSSACTRGGRPSSSARASCQSGKKLSDLDVGEKNPMTRRHLSAEVQTDELSRLLKTFTAASCRASWARM